jgi:hypothetical protein
MTPINSNKLFIDAQDRTAVTVFAASGWKGKELTGSVFKQLKEWNGAATG